MKYNVLWFDDEWEDLSDIIDDALAKDINLIGQTNAEDGLAYLIEKHKLIDAVLIDGQFYRGSGNTGNVNAEVALSKVIDTIEAAIGTGDIPWFVLSGKDSFITGESSSIAELKIDKVYNKRLREDKEALWVDIKEAVSRRPESAVKVEYKDVLDCFRDAIIGSNNLSDFLELLLALSSKDKQATNPFNTLRKVFEDWLNGLITYGFLNDELRSRNGSPNMNWSVRALKGLPVSDLDLERNPYPLLNKTLGAYADLVLHSTNSQSHTSDGGHNQYELKATLNALCTLLLWLKQELIDADYI